VADAVSSIELKLLRPKTGVNNNMYMYIDHLLELIDSFKECK